MRKTDILLIVLFVVFVLGIAFGPALLDRWQARDADRQAEVEPQPVERETNAGLDENERMAQEAEIERVSGMLMLHKACVNRFDGFEAESRQTMETWKKRHEALLATRPEQDFHIVLAQPEGLDETATEKASGEERALCERNLEAMRKELAGAGE